MLVNVALLGLLFAFASTKKSELENLPKELSITTYEEQLVKKDEAPEHLLSLCHHFDQSMKLMRFFKNMPSKQKICPIKEESSLSEPDEDESYRNRQKNRNSSD